jgi:hypothetical protein
LNLNNRNQPYLHLQAEVPGLMSSENVDQDQRERDQHSDGFEFRRRVYPVLLGTMIRNPEHVLGVEPRVEKPDQGRENHEAHDGDDKINHLFVANEYASRVRLSGIRAAGRIISQSTE